MNNSREMAVIIVGAVIGGVAGYLFFTERGRSTRRQIELALEDFPHVANRIERVRVAIEGLLPSRQQAHET